jgi:glycosyltransferase involved in cell wall biosynthesis
MAVKIFLHIPDDHACTVYRAAMPMMHLYSDLSNHGIHITGSDKTLPKEMFDIYIFNRLIRPEFYLNVVDPLLKMGKKLVWQADDDLWNIPKWNPASKLLNMDDLNATELYLNICKSLWVSTNELANTVKRPEKTKVLPNLIDINQFDDVVHDDGPIKIVWCGSSSHDKDFDVVVEPIIKIAEKYKDKIAVIFWGYLPTALANFERQPGFPYANLVPKYDNLFFGEWFSNREYFHKLRPLKPDIALMPLDNCEFNYSKSNLKYLEMSMAGAACIATYLPPYESIKDKETGLKVRNSQEWYDALDELIQNKTYRNKLNANACEQVRQQYCWQCPARQLWLQAFLDLTLPTSY